MRGKNVRATIAALVTAALLYPASAQADGPEESSSRAPHDSHASAGLRIDGRAPDCTEIPPGEVPPVAVATTPVLPLEVRVMTERRHLGDTKTYMKATVDSFSRIGIRLKVSYDVVIPPSTWKTGFLQEASSDEIFKFMKARYRGKRPRGVDLVYYMTAYWSGGMADCIGGVAFADQAFAFGSIDYATEGLVPQPLVNEGFVAAHELGHLLGAHHHYSNCAEALPSGATRTDLGPCTTMFPLATGISGTFGLLERSFIRHYTARYAKG